MIHLKDFLSVCLQSLLTFNRFNSLQTTSKELYYLIKIHFVSNMQQVCLEVNSETFYDAEFCGQVFLPVTQEGIFVQTCNVAEHRLLSLSQGLLHPNVYFCLGKAHAHFVELLLDLQPSDCRKLLGKTYKLKEKTPENKYVLSDYYSPALYASFSFSGCCFGCRGASIIVPNNLYN